MRTAEYDLLTWVSFPSSVKLINDEERAWARLMLRLLTVRPGSTLNFVVRAKQQSVSYTPSHIRVDAWNGKEWRAEPPVPDRIVLPLGSFDWAEFTTEYKNPEDITAIIPGVFGGAGSKALPGITWFDDLKIYQDGVLIYAEDFLAPVLNLAAGMIPVLAVGAVVGAQELQRARVLG